MNAVRLTACCFFIGLVCLPGADAFAQQQKSAKGKPWQYHPSSSTLSPYLNLTNPDTGPLPNYFSLTRPQLQQMDINNRQKTITQQQEDEINRLDKSFSVRNSEVKPTGTGAGFMNFDHFYSGGGAGSTPARPPKSTKRGAGS